MLCPFKNCSTSNESHDFDATTCKLNLTGSSKRIADREELDYYNLSENAKENLQDIQNKYSLSADSDIESKQDAVLCHCKCNMNENLKKKTDSGDKALDQNPDRETEINKASRFYLEWKAAEKRETLKHNPKLLITSLMSSFPNTELQKRFQIARWIFQEFELESLYNILCAFLNDEYPDDLFCFDIYIRGCLNAYRRSQSSIQKTSEDLQKPMRSSVDKISEGSEAKSKQSDIERIENLTTTPQEPKSDEKLTTVKFKGYFCAPVYFIINEKGKLDGINTFRANDDLTEYDIPLLCALEYACPTSLSMMSQLSWRELSTMFKFTDDSYCTKEQRLWEGYMSKNLGHKVRSPEIITAITTTAELRGFICEPVSIIMYDENSLDVTKTLKICDNISISDVKILSYLERNKISAAWVSQLSWEEVKKNYRKGSSMNGFAVNTPKSFAMIPVTFIRLINN